jgi:hypothetical protein
MTSPSTLSHYRAPSRPVRRDDESAGEYGARIAERRATQRKHYLRRKRKEAAQELAAQRAAIVAPIEAPRLSLWQRINRWFA